MKGIEPSYAALEAAVLPLNYASSATRRFVPQFAGSCSLANRRRLQRERKTLPVDRGRGKFMDRVESVFIAGAMTGFLVLMGAMAWLMMVG